MTLAKKMGAYFLLVVLVATGGFAYTIYGSNKAQMSVEDLKEYEILRLEKTNDIAYNVLGESYNMKGYLLYGTDQYLNEFRRLADLNAKLEDELIKEARTEDARSLSVDIKALNIQYHYVLNLEGKYLWKPVCSRESGKERMYYMV